MNKMKISLIIIATLNEAIAKVYRCAYFFFAGSASARELLYCFASNGKEEKFAQIYVVGFFPFAHNLVDRALVCFLKSLTAKVAISR